MHSKTNYLQQLRIKNYLKQFAKRYVSYLNNKINYKSQ